jgi:superfamily I DNA/RNA helicase
MTAISQIKLAIGENFLDAFSRIPRTQQRKVNEFLSKFRRDPTASGINFEKIEQAADPGIRSVRIDKAYRGILFKPPKGNVYVMLWVDHHDDAYQWARNRTVRIHPETGGLQVFSMEESAALPDEPATEPKTPIQGLFDEIHNRHLLRLGVPEAKLPEVRRVDNEPKLERLVPSLPAEAAEALLCLAAGFTLEETFQEMGKTDTAHAVDTEDFTAALENPDSLRRFTVVEDELELARVLAAPLEKWRIFLHPSQRGLVNRDWNGPVRVLGGAGTGKTVVAMHRTRWLARNAFPEETDRILMTTFTRNLADDIRENLSAICDPKTMERIEVINLDRWVVRFLKRQDYDHEIVFGLGDRTRPLWEQALQRASADLNLPETFYREEWERVIQPGEMRSLADYFGAVRVGRGTPLGRKERKAVWPVFEEYLALLNENRLREMEDAMRDARIILRDKGPILPYRAVVVDEAQDLSPQAFRLLREMAPAGKNDLFIVGDAHQRIYRHQVVLSRCGVELRNRGRRLKINYRTTEEIRRWSVGLLRNQSIDNLDGSADSVTGYRSLLHGAAPRVQRFADFQTEAAAIAEYVSQHAAGEAEGEGDGLRDICLVARTHSLLENYAAALAEKGIPVYKIKPSEREDRTRPGLRLATMHRVKGLEFDRMIIAGVNADTVPLPAALNAASDPAVRAEAEVRERALLYVAATRARREVRITGWGEPSPFLLDGFG